MATENMRQGTCAVPPMRAFSITGDLPTGTTLIEASAGTGKTWTVAGLVARYVAEVGMPLDRLLVVTFSRAASQELRARVRSRLEETLLALESADPPDDAQADPLVAHLRRCSPEQLALRVSRLREALADFDTATIATIHQFCHIVLKSLGVAGDSDPGAVLAEDLTQLRDDVVDDLFLADHLAGVEHAPSYATAVEDARKALENPGAVLSPQRASGALGARLAFAHRVREEFARRKRRAGVLSYDDLLGQLADALEDTDGPARARMRDHWSVVLVDEFQDTDPVQWQVFSRAFVADDKTLILIGDPKQAIYGFRGGDVETYLGAAATATTRTSLPTNFRSDAPLVAALQVLMSGVTLSEGIVAHPIKGSRSGRRLRGAPDDSPVRLRTVSVGPDGKDPKITAARDIIYPDVADDIARLLSSGATFDDQPVQPQHIGVLCHTTRDLRGIRKALEQRGIPSVLVSTESVLRTAAADWWLQLLLALEQPHRLDRVRLAALTPFLGWNARQLDEQGEDGVEDIARSVRALLAAFHRGGIAAVLDVARSGGLAERLLGRAGGERDVTDIEHVAQLLQEQVAHGTGGVSSLVAWLTRQSANDAVVTADSRIMRLDSDALAVTLSTIHGSKGLQYPIVYAPFLFDNWISDKETATVLHRGGQRLLAFDDEALNGSERRSDALGEHMRLTYVAMTRAQSQLVMWWAPTWNSKNAGLTRLLFGQAEDPAGLAALLAARERADTPVVADPLTLTDPLARQRPELRQQMLQTWSSHGAFSLEEVERALDRSTVEVGWSTEPLATRRFDETIVDRAWRRTSYSALTAAAERAGEAQSEPEDGTVGRTDEEPVALDDAPADTGAVAPPSPMADQPVGATFGSLVHAVLEHADFQSDDLLAEVRDRIGEELLWWPVELDVDELAAAIVAVCRTPLGRLAGDVRLVDIAKGDRLPEMEFEVPLAGGDRPHPHSRLRAMAGALRDHLPEGDPLRTYAEVLDGDELGEQSLRGYLTGSIDLAFRHDGRYFVVDYKTNWLGAPGEPLTLSDYAPGRLVAAMNHSSYPLQAILYAVVLHRYLRWRLPDYDPEKHIGGVLYLYLRGMAGPDSPSVDGHTSGVFAWRPPVVLLDRLSDILDGAGR